jgi:hypothetical protein
VNQESYLLLALECSLEQWHLVRHASARVNLAAGVTGPSLSAALRLLGDFYFEKNDAEEAVQFYYRLYLETRSLDPVVLERLAELCVQTHRNESAKAFRKELSRLCPESTKP